MKEYQTIKVKLSNNLVLRHTLIGEGPPPRKTFAIITALSSRDPILFSQGSLIFVDWLAKYSNVCQHFTPNALTMLISMFFFLLCVDSKVPQVFVSEIARC